MDTQGALDSLLGRLTTVLVNEAQLLGGLRSDVEFIKDEMESMNGLILHLTEAQHRDHQVRAWMKQVVGLTRDCEGNVELYIHYVGSRPGDDGFLGCLRRVLRFVRTIPVRHRIATRIQELKVRARDVGDRRQRYGVTVPASTSVDMNVVDVEPSDGEEDHRRRTVLLDAAEPPPDAEEVVRRGIDSLMKSLSWEPATEDGALPPQVRVFSILGRQFACEVAERVYQQHSSVGSIFDCKAAYSYDYREDVGRVLAKILEQVGGGELQPSQEEDEVANQAAGTTIDDDREKQLISKIQGHLKGKRFLIVLDVWVSISEWKRTLDALLQAADGCLPGSAIIVRTDDYDLALSSCPYKIIKATYPYYNYEYQFFIDKATDLCDGLCKTDASDFFELSKTETFAMKTFLHLLYVNPNRTEEELQNYKKAISECIRLKKSIPKQVLQWCYNELPSKYRSCLLYLTVFPEGHVIRTTQMCLCLGAHMSPPSGTIRFAGRFVLDEAITVEGIRS